MTFIKYHIQANVTQARSLTSFLCSQETKHVTDATCGHENKGMIGGLAST